MVHWSEYLREAKGGFNRDVLSGLPNLSDVRHRVAWTWNFIWTLIVRTFGACAVVRTLQSFHLYLYRFYVVHVVGWYPQVDAAHTRFV
jgi:hypothetical protein